ncbi:nucleoside triphosphate pyrophosphohydrolase [Pleionea sp. CnH1-48]|uniref:nucleoside triphosphate pyrophosphohydrolase n=1 Tax=Pleionea sp. CnH1-48 TaxID=2954494 RepID=UPI002097BB6E|nr:nucleoside triphosphate pyrophosphohydrolase [Pleionea sp. CnH1-48]MCO7223889.1 nucleoside triphosphate pyrophosphohydrolase [Pleionea sp. CnH1-48]
MTKLKDNHSSMQSLLDVMTQLRDPESGCPWDLKQSYSTIVPYTIEETYEVADAIEREDFVDLKGELGDLLFQVVFYCQLAKEDQHFEFDDVVEGVCHKLITRHPHVFSDVTYESEEAFHKAWESQKHKEREQKNEASQASMMDDIPKSLPALKASQKMQKRAARAGFDWPDVSGVWEKIDEEIAEIHQEIPQDASQSPDKDRLEDEVGDLLFACVNLSRHLGIDAESALARANKKFSQRFRVMEALVDNEDEQLDAMSLQRMDEFWELAKAQLAKK